MREAVEAFPELYFARLVLLGEGDSEQVVLPRLLSAQGVGVDLSSISIAPLGGRHVNHFWRLLNALGIPYLTLLDLDVARHGGGWGRVRYVCKQLREFPGSGRGGEITDGSSHASPRGTTARFRSEPTNEASKPSSSWRSAASSSRPPWISTWP